MAERRALNAGRVTGSILKIPYKVRDRILKRMLREIQNGPVPYKDLQRKMNSWMPNININPFLRYLVVTGHVVAGKGGFGLAGEKQAGFREDHWRPRKPKGSITRVKKTPKMTAMQRFAWSRSPGKTKEEFMGVAVSKTASMYDTLSTAADHNGMFPLL